ncbi:class I SAM-dependent methyltransferase [Mycobacterium celatum]|uniref:Class I SAM-dependent methyltransferase n=1 Tax=Mycobacterium celatum TaxID=28045 RepID=A0A2G5PLZ5_MYCCE|nr:class I SAM-dependent methyltransferase [Mycobacterium celatum]
MTGLTTTTKIRWSIRYVAFLLRIGTRHPSVLWHFLACNLRYILVKLGVLPSAARHVAEVRAAFEEHAAQGQFKERWFDMSDVIVIQWCAVFSGIFDRAAPVSILEIGSWEGRSSLFLLTYFTRGRLTAVDTWAGIDYYLYNATPDGRDLEARFDGNLAPCATRLIKRKGSSLHVLPQLLDEQQEFDLIYVDGSHFADDVLMDGITAWRLLKQGGVMIFDDFLWPCYPRARANPWWAIDQFLTYHAGEYKVLAAYDQIILQKKTRFTDRVTADLTAVQWQ